MKLRLCIAGALAASALPVDAALAQSMTHRAEYRVSFIGLPVANATFTTTLDGERFSVDGSLSSAGVANILGRTEGSTRVSGVKTADSLQASDYRVSYTSGDDAQTMEVTFNGGSVVSAVLTPPKKRTRPDWVPVSEGDLQSVLDPVAGFMVPGDADVCDRTIALFDGETRLDVHLRNAGTQPFEAEGFAGEAIVCTARAEPKAGYHAESSTVDYMRSAEAEIWFARDEAADLYAPVFARVPTKLGPVRITATSFGS